MSAFNVRRHSLRHRLLCLLICVGVLPIVSVAGAVVTEVVAPTAAAADHEFGHVDVGGIEVDPIPDPEGPDTEDPLPVPLPDELPTDPDLLVRNSLGFLCTETNSEEICAFEIASYDIRTDFVKTDGSHVIKTTPATLFVPQAIDVDDDLDDDILVEITGVTGSPVGLEELLSTQVVLTVDRTNNVTATMPLSVEALIADPGEDDGVISVGYDSRATSAPTRWQADAAILVGAETEVDATVRTSGAASALDVIGGRITTDEDGVPQKVAARLGLTPVPSAVGVGFRIGPNAKSGKLWAATETRATLDIVIADGDQTTHVASTINDLQLPVEVVLDRQPWTVGDGVVLQGFRGMHIHVTTEGDVAEASALYEDILGEEVLTRLRLTLKGLPEAIDFRETPSGVLVDTDGPIGVVAGGVATAANHGVVMKEEVGSPAGIRPHDPVERTDASYVEHAVRRGVESTTFRLAGIEHVQVSQGGSEANPRMTINGRLTAADVRVYVSDDTLGTVYETTVSKVPHNFWVRLAFSDVQVVGFCGSSNDASDPCSANGQTDPAPISRLIIHRAFNPGGLFADATTLTGEVRDIPSVLHLMINTHTPEGADMPDRIHVDTDNPIGRVDLQAGGTNITPYELPPDNGVRFSAEPFRLSVRIDGLHHARIDTASVVDPETAERNVTDIKVTLIGAEKHSFNFWIVLPTVIDGVKNTKLFVGDLVGRPARTQFTFSRGQGEPLEFVVRGADRLNQPAGTKRINVNARQLHSSEDDLLHEAFVNLELVPPVIAMKIHPFERVDAFADFVGKLTEKTSADLDLDLVTYLDQPIGLVDISLRGGWEPLAEYQIPIPADQSGAVILTDTLYYNADGTEWEPPQSYSFIPPPPAVRKRSVLWLDAQVHDLRSFSFRQSPLHAMLDVAVPRDFRLYLNTGLGDPINTNDCGEYDEHNYGHVEWVDVIVRNMQPKTQFDYRSFAKATGDPCDRPTAHLIDYQAEGRAKTVAVNMSIGDMAVLNAYLGNPGLPVPKRLSLCQASYDYCLKKVGKIWECAMHNFCQRDDASLSLYLNAYGHRTHIKIDYCALNDRTPDATPGAEKCLRLKARRGVFVRDLEVDYLDLGFYYSALDEISGRGFLALDTRSPSTRKLGRVKGFISKVDLDSVAPFVNLNIASGSGTDIKGSSWDKYVMPFEAGTKGRAWKHGIPNCVNPQPMGDLFFNSSETYLHAVLESPTAEHDDLGDNITPILCDSY